MTLRTNAPHAKRRWSALFLVVAIALGLMATTVLANHVTPADAPSFVYRNDDDGADDEPGQKDLNRHSSATDSDGFWVTFTWDVTSLKGNNTADGCSLFDTSSPYNGLVDAAICITAESSPLQFKSAVIYTCSDNRNDRCTNPDVVEGPYGTECFVIDGVTDPFHPTLTDTQALCLVDLGDINTTVTPKLVNSCSYPSQEPNSDPSDCVVKISITSGITTQPTGSTTWTATLEDVATVSPSDATGTVTFRLYNAAGCADAAKIWTSSAVPVSSGTADSVNSVPASETGSNTVSSAGGVTVFYWTATYAPTAGTDWLPFTTACGEATTITPASVSGAAG